LGLEREMLVAYILVAPKRFIGLTAGGNVLERSDFPKLLAEEFSVLIPQHLCQEWVRIDDVAAIRVENQDTVLRRFEQASITQFRRFQEYFGPAAPDTFRFRNGGHINTCFFQEALPPPCAALMILGRPEPKLPTDWTDSDQR